jgi:hypothetical protein
MKSNSIRFALVLCSMALGALGCAVGPVDSEEEVAEEDVGQAEQPLAISYRQCTSSCTSSQASCEGSCTTNSCINFCDYVGDDCRDACFDAYWEP